MKNRTSLTLTIINSIILLLVVVWFLIGRFFVMPADSFTILLLDVGSIMGAIFAAGGLVVALVSIFTLFSIDNKVEQGVNATYEKLLPQLTNRTNQQIEGYLAYLQATEAEDWENAEKYAKKALEHFPQLSEVRSFLARRMSRDVAAYFLGSRYNLPTVLNLRASRLTSRPNRPPLTEAIEWLEGAIAQGEDTKGELWATLATMYGVNHRFNKMRDAITKALNIDPALKAQFCQPNQLIMLVYGCDNNEHNMQALGEMLNLTLPVSQETVCVNIEKASLDTSYQYMDWFVIKQPSLLGPQPVFPITIRFSWDREDNITIASAQILDPTKVPEQVPSFESTLEAKLSRPLIPIKELVVELAKRFAFIAEY